MVFITPGLRFLISLCFLRIKAQSYGGECVWYIHMVHAMEIHATHPSKTFVVGVACESCGFGFLFSKTKTKDANCVVYGWHDERKVHHTIPFPFTSTHAFVTSFLRFVFFLYYTERTKQLRTPTLLPFILCFGFDLLVLFVSMLSFCFPFQKRQKRKKKQYKK
jgi:hypothetical protein